MQSDLEISKALALAIGWDKGRVFESETFGLPCIVVQYDINRQCRTFDYRDWNVIAPIAERYDMFPRQTGRQWAAANWNNTVYADTPQKVIAMAVIGTLK